SRKISLNQPRSSTCRLGTMIRGRFIEVVVPLLMKSSLSAAWPRALGRRPSDEFAVPLCRSHHRAVHRAGDERGWWQITGIDPIKVARKLWKHTRVNEGRLSPDRTAADSDRRTKISDGG